MESVRKDVECSFGILNKIFLILKNAINHHFPENIEAIFITCCGLHNWLHDHNGWDDWERRGMVSEEDVAVEYDICDQNNQQRGGQFSLEEFNCNFTRLQMRRRDPTTFLTMMKNAILTLKLNGRHLTLATR